MLHYQLEFDDYKQHLIHVTVRFLAQPRQQLWLPTWIPGSYLIREFAKHLENVKAYDENGRALKIAKSHKNRWELFNQEYELISVEYDVYAYDLSVRGSYVDQQRIYINPAAVCLALHEQEQQVHELELFLPAALAHFNYAGALKAKSLVKGRFTVKADNYQQLIDSPFELAQQQRFQFCAADIMHEFVISGQHQANLTRLQHDLTQICQYQIQFFGSAPFQDYTFLTMATGNLYGGLEHGNSTSLITPRDDLPQADEKETPSENYQRFLGLCSHEYFHAWLVKYIRPQNFVNYNLNEEAYTRLLWIFEGFTSYYDDLILLKSGVISQDDYLKLLTEQINRYLQNPGRHIQSVSESSFDAWIKFYRQDENSNQAGTSYYNKGALVALCLDLGLRKHGSSLDAVVRQLYQNAQNGIAVQEQTIYQICQQLTGQDWTDRLDYLINTTEELPFAEVLAQFGIEYQTTADKVWAFGCKIQEKPEGLLLQQVFRNGTAAQAGLSANDVVVAIDGIKATEKVWLAKAKSGKMMSCHAFRRDELIQFELKGEETVFLSAKLQVSSQKLLDNWFKTA